jgi:hypothetical protein
MEEYESNDSCNDFWSAMEKGKAVEGKFGKRHFVVPEAILLAIAQQGSNQFRKAIGHLKAQNVL